MRLRILQIEGIAISISGFVLLIEIIRAVQWNIFWLDRAVVTDPRFSLYIGTAVSIAVVLIARGVTGSNVIAPAGRTFSMFIEAPLTLVVALLLITIAHSWRIRTDVAPLDRATTDVMPVLIRLIANGWPVYVVTALVGAAVATVFWRTLRLSEHTAT